MSAAHNSDAVPSAPTPPAPRKTPRQQRGRARVQLPQRQQIEIQMLAIDQMLEADHRVRLVWAYAEACDLTELYDRIQAVEHHVGRDPIDPRLLFALWLYATIEGLSSARKLAERTERDLPYRWLCGGVSVNHHRLSDFRVDHAALLDRLLVDSVAVLLHQNLITLQTIGQDGMRVRASAGSSSFRREASLAEALRTAQAHVQQLAQEHAADPSADDRRRRAAQERATRERVERIEQAQAELLELEAQRAQQSSPPKNEPRASTTDPEARKMKMGDGGFRPAYNVQFATDADQRIIVGVEVTAQGTDFGQMQPMHARLQQDYGRTPERYLVDGGFVKHADVTVLEAAGTEVYAPLPREAQDRAAGRDPHQPKRDDPPEVAAFRARMGTDAAKAEYRRRSSVAEFPNAECRNRGLTQFRVRGRVQALAQTLWHVLAFNFLRFVKLGCLEVVMG